MDVRLILPLLAGVPLTHLNIATTMQNIINTYNLTPADRTYLVMPLFHVHGLICGLLATLLSGGSAVIPQKFSAGVFWKDFVENKCNWYTAGKSIPGFIRPHGTSF
jgi:oxalate---CoA ligase